MKIREVNENKKQFISLLLLADEQESMVDNALDIIEFVNSKLGSSVLMMGGLSLGGQILLEILSQRKDICKFRKLDAK